MDIRYVTLETRFGRMLLTASGERLTGVYFEGQKYHPAIGASWREDPRAAPLAAACAQLDAYARGGLDAFELPLGPAGTPFQQRVWAELLRVRRGETISYGTLAARIGMPSAVRAVGAAVGRNPISVIVPCHRIVGADGTLTGYAGGLERKRALLEHEAAWAA